MLTTLSLHITSKCNLNCPFCYRIKNNIHTPPNWLLDVPKIARDLGITQIPIGGGEPTLYPRFLDKFTQNCQNNDILPNLTSNGYNILSLSEKTLNRFGCISLSFDKYKIKQIGLRKLNKTVIKLRKIIRTDTNLGINYLLLDKESLMLLPIWIGSLLDKVDYFYILHLKLFPVNYTAKDLKIILDLLAPLLRNKLLIDDSIALSLNKREYCRRGNELIAIFPNGDVCPCSFSKPISNLREMNLKEIIEMYWPLPATEKCPFVI